MRPTSLRKITDDIIPPLFIVWTCDITTLAIFIPYLRGSTLDGIKVIVDGFYNPNQNIFFPPYIAGINPYALIYLIFFTSLPFLHFIHKLRGRKTDRRTGSPIFATALHAGFTLFCLLTVLQTTSLINYARVEFGTFAGKSGEKKNTAIAGKKLCSFIQYCREILPGFHNAQLLTDMDLSNDPGMITQRMLAYYLYPIDIRNVRGGRPVDSILVFDKADAVASVPDDFKVIGTFDQSSV